MSKDNVKILSYFSIYQRASPNSEWDCSILLKKWMPNMGKHKENGRSNDKFVQIDQDKIQDHFREIVRGTVEETLNNLLDVKAA